MMVTKQQLVELLRQEGDEGTARQAEIELPDQVDTERDSELLDKYGINVSDLAGGGAGLDEAAPESEGAGAVGVVDDEGRDDDPPKGGQGGAAHSSFP